MDCLAWCCALLHLMKRELLIHVLALICYEIVDVPLKAINCYSTRIGQSFSRKGVMSCRCGVPYGVYPWG